MKLDNITKWIMTYGQHFLIGDSLSWELLIGMPGTVKEEASDGKLLGKKKMRYETHTRAWIKSIVWRLMGIVILGAISFAITRSWREMSLITILFHSIRVVLYYLHERAWERIQWGRIKHPLSVLPVRKTLSPEDLNIVRNQLEKLGYLD
jgi:uncharacterized membrane protein